MVAKGLAGTCHFNALLCFLGRALSATERSFALDSGDDATEARDSMESAHRVKSQVCNHNHNHPLHNPRTTPRASDHKHGQCSVHDPSVLGGGSAAACGGGLGLRFIGGALEACVSCDVKMSRKVASVFRDFSSRRARGRGHVSQ